MGKKLYNKIFHSAMFDCSYLDSRPYALYGRPGTTNKKWSSYLELGASSWICLGLTGRFTPYPAIFRILNNFEHAQNFCPLLRF